MPSCTAPNLDPVRHHLGFVAEPHDQRCCTPYGDTEIDEGDRNPGHTQRPDQPKNLAIQRLLGERRNAEEESPNARPQGSKSWLFSVQ